MAFAIRKEIAGRLAEAPRGISDRLITLRIRIATNHDITLINVYAPRMTYPDEVRETFYAQRHQQRPTGRQTYPTRGLQRQNT